MSIASETVLWIMAFLSALWVCYVLWLIQGWKHLWLGNDPKFTEATTVSIIIPARNEAAALQKLLPDLERSLKKHPYVEVILVDDSSTDQTINIANELGKTLHHFKCTSAAEEGKKAALAQGISLAKGDWIITLDADVSLPPNWFRNLAPNLQEGIQMLILPIIFQGKGFLQTAFSLEFLSLAGTTGATASNGYPFLCNGAFLAFRKAAYEKVGGYASHKNQVSGDDVFLLHQIKKQYPDQVLYLLKDALIARTNAPQNINSFFKQRIRWAAKAGVYKDALAIVTSWLVFLHNASLLVGLLALVWNPWLWMPLVVCFSSKFIIDLLFLFLVARKLGETPLLRAYIPVAVLYPFYVCIAALMTLFYRPDWKGR